jgi:hypothetical protein
MEEKRDYHVRDPESGRFKKIMVCGIREFILWCAMKERCNNPHNKCYGIYGARGIKVCKEWSDSFASFNEWAIANGYQEGLTIDRIDTNGNYCPENCRWVTTAQQNRNYSRNHFLTYNGETLCLKDMAEKHGIKPCTLLFRLKSGLTLDLALQNIDRRSLRFK